MTHWDDAAATLAGARAAVWPDPDATTACLSYLAPAFVGGRLLDVGCGIGRLTIPVARDHPGCEVVGYDPSRSMLRWATEAAWVADVAVRWTDDLATVGPVDGAWSMVTFQHLPPSEQRDLLAAVASLLRPGGVFRFQFQSRGDTGPLAHPVPERQMAAWCEAAGLRLTAVDRGFVWEPPPPWVWFTTSPADRGAHGTVEA